MVQSLKKRYPRRFSSQAAAKRYCGNLWFPKSKRWMYQLNGKSGNTFILGLLFELEFGVPFQAALSTKVNQHPDFALFQTCIAGVLANVAQRELSLQAFQDMPALRLATVRNPFDRALSGFFYLCRSQTVGDQRFLTERIRIQAMTQFDWTLDPNTPHGFVKFLSYVAQMQAQGDPMLVDAHWLPQEKHIEPTIYKPDLIGRTEAMGGFARNIAARLETDLPEEIETRLSRNESANSATRTERRAQFYSDPEAANLVRQIYEQDFELFGYEPDLNA